MSRLRTVRLLWGVGLTAVAVLVTLKLVVPDKPRANSPEVVKESYPRTLAPVVGRANIRYSTSSAAETEELTEVGECLQRNHLAPWFRTHDWPETCLVFYGKPIMLVLKSISRQRRWRVKLILKDSPAGLEDLQSLVSKDRFLVVITNSRAYHHPIIRELSNSTNALVSTIENAHKVTGAKRIQLSVFRDHFQLFGCSLEEADIMPRSFVLSDPTQCVQFFKYGNAHPKTWWVLKPSDGYGGDGITIHSNLSTLYKEYGTCTKHDDYIVQEYLPDLLLLQNRKFDVRALILISGTSPYLLFHHEGYLRVSVKEFDLSGGREVHLTNSHVQFNAEGFQVNKHFWSFQQLQNYLDENHPDNNEFVSNKLIPFIHKISIFILQSAIPILTRAPSAYQFLGLDFMVTSNFHVWFIEANNYPLWPKGTQYIDDLMHRLGDDMFNLLLDIRRHPDWFRSMRPGDMYGTWQLIWNEIYAKCSNSPPYDPCKEFVS